ncbi:hypothetical protein ZEAMMB73_Zm00001d004968 [Zea mays]|uniref:Uncharacterized protein n=1 Tax=Zea mays TaxID=4577 RepID=A0A1D6EIC6_MAIZE|nr:hypothetical protein ZEAMMB73_Zm00001d004968 [Zea mays]
MDNHNLAELMREDQIELLMELVLGYSKVLSSTARASRCPFHLVEKKSQGKRRSLITSKVGYISETLQPIIEEVFEVQLLMVL